MVLVRLKWPVSMLFLVTAADSTFLSSCTVGLQAAVSALKQFPAVNAVIDGDDIIYRDYVDISIAVGTAKVRVPNFVYVLLSSPVNHG